MATGIERRTLLSWMVEPDERAPIRSTAAGAESFSATSVGSTTTTIATALTEAANSGYVGQVLRCVAGTSANVGVDVEITGFAAATDTLTHTAFPSATAIGDQFVIWLPPDPICAVTTSGTTVTASARNEAQLTPRGGSAAAFWIGDVLVARRSATVTQGATTVAITGFASGTGAFTHTAITSTTLGDLFHLRRFPKLWGPPALKWDREDLKQETQRGNFSVDADIPGSKSWTCEVVLPLKGANATAASGTAATAPPELHRPLSAIFATTQGTSRTVAAGSTTSIVQVTDGGATTLPVGTLVMDANGRCAVVTAVAADAANPDDITVAPPFARAPVTSELLRAGYSYEPKTTGHLTMTMDAYIGGVAHLLAYGGLPTVKLSEFKRGSVPKITLSYRGGFWVQTPVATPAGLLPSFDSVRPIAATNLTVILGASTRLIVDELEIDLGIEIADEPSVSLPDGVYGGRIVGMAPTIAIKGRLDTASPNDSFAELQRYAGGQPFSLLVQHGLDSGGTVAFYSHQTRWKNPSHGVVDGLRTIDLVAQVTASELTDMPDFLLGFI